MGDGGSTIRPRGTSGTDSSTGDSATFPEEVDTSGQGDLCIINEQATLASTNRDALRAIWKGDILDVELDGASAVAINSDGDVVGSITESWIGQLKECVSLGHVYEAETTLIDGGRCDVIVRNK